MPNVEISWIGLYKVEFDTVGVIQQPQVKNKERKNALDAVMYGM